MLAYIIIILWSVLGCIATNFLPLPKTKKQAKIMLFLLGPICWFIIVIALI